MASRGVIASKVGLLGEQPMCGIIPSFHCLILLLSDCTNCGSILIESLLLLFSRGHQVVEDEPGDIDNGSKAFNVLVSVFLNNLFEGFNEFIIKLS